ncbi:MAG: OprO/OprP family phosphate-selective porin [Dysgonamonadaceae bacterium]|jgi:hypothetical protein|nr:OprO/OprP family phosphate-selective porin [Dysgonamonadaceae bacterium]
MKRKSYIFVIFVMLFSVSHSQDAKKLKDAFRSEAFQLYGYGQIIANASEFPARGMARTTSEFSFDVARAILFAQGKLGDKQQFGYMLMYDFGPSSGLHELYGEWLPNPAFNLRFGQWKIPFTIENPMSPTRVETIYFSRSVSAMSGSAGDFNQYGRGGAVSVKAGRDAGLQASGQLLKKSDFYQIEYYAGLFNGTGVNTKDNNSKKDFVASLYYQPIKGLKLGGSVYSGTITMVEEAAGLAAGDFSRNAYAISGVFDSKYVYARSEFMSGKTGSVSREGYYATAAWKLVPGKWEILGKFDFFDSDKAIADNETLDITAGINYYLAYLTRVQLNYIYTNDRALGKNNALAAQLQLFF